jgi:hypothetical protein
MSLLCVLETGVDPTSETHEDLIRTGFAPRPSWAADTAYVGRIDLSREDLIEWLAALDWTPQRDIPHRPMLMFIAAGEREFSYYAVPTGSAEVGT